MPTKIHVILLTETWISNETQALALQLPNYTHYYNYRPDKKGGGVSAYIHNNLKHSMSDSEYLDGNNYLWIRLENYSVEIGIIYNPGHTNYQNFLETFSNQLQKRNRAIVFGDFNIDLLTTNKQTKQYKSLLNEAGFTILNKITKKYCTRESSTRKSIIDHVSTNLKNDYFHMAIIESAMSDHKQICIELKKIRQPPKIRTQFEAIDYDKLQSTAKEIRLNNSDDNYMLLENSIKHHINKSKIIKTKILNPPQKDWICKDIIDGIQQRNLLWKELKCNPLDRTLEKKFETYKTDLANLIKNTKDIYYYNKFTQLTKKPKKMWKLVNNLACNTIKESPAPSKLIIQSKHITNAKEICEEFNKYFATIGPLLANEIPKHYHDDYEQALPQTMTNSKLLTLDPCSSDEILKIINSLDSTSSTGLDGISTKSIKCIKNLISDRLTNCLNKLLKLGKFPDSLKIAKVTPIFKSGAKTDPGNYRPISVLPTISKIFEKIINSRLEQYLKSIDFIFERQYGFRPKSNTLTATVDLVTKIKSNIDNKNIVLGVFIDLKKAFDTVSHSLLIKKLKHIGVDGTALQMFQSYLTNRFQIVKINNAQSTKRPITCGIPQGSITGPLLFLTYINNIRDIGLHGHVSLYADDTCLFYFGSSIQQIVAHAQEDLNKLFSWFQYNLLTINISKTCYVIFKSRNKVIPSHDALKINNIIIQEKACEKYLGLRMDSGLTWNAQIEHIRTKLSSLTGSLRRIVRCIPRQIRYTIYNSLVKPHLLYLIQIWGSAAKTKLADLQIQQNKIIKVLFHYNFLTPTSQIYKETKLMTIKQLYIYNTCILLRKIIKRSLHTSLSFITLKQLTARPLRTRRASLLVLPRTRTNTGKKMFTYEGAQLYNNLPSTLKHVNSFHVFKTKLSEHIIQNYPP